MLLAALPRVRARVHGVWGTRDVYALPDLEARARALVALSPGARFHPLPGAGHWAMYERAAAFDALLPALLDAR